MYNFFLEDFSLLSILYLKKIGNPSLFLGATTNQNFIFLYLLFISMTPVFYISGDKRFLNWGEHLLYMVVIYLGSLIFLLVNNFFLFILFYELLILPIFLILRFYGHYYRKTQAAFFILIWALLGSFFLFLGFFFLSYYNILNFFERGYAHTCTSYWSLFFFILGFAVKVPMWPFHFWISRAHAEGPTNLSIFLSGVLVKLSVFGILRVMDIFLIKTYFIIFYFLALVGVMDSTLKMLLQIDSKVVVAFSTTVQMNFILFILFSVGASTKGALNLGLVNHMLTASLLFFLTDTILVRFNTREFFFLSGLNHYLPLLSFFLLISLVNQINFPGFLGFILDINFLLNMLPVYPLSSFLLFFFLFVIEHLYIFFFFLKVVFGASSKFSFVFLKDVTYVELLLFFYLLKVSLFWGLFPFFFFIVF